MSCCYYLHTPMTHLFARLALHLALTYHNLKVDLVAVISNRLLKYFSLVGRVRGVAFEMLMVKNTFSFSF